MNSTAYPTEAQLSGENESLDRRNRCVGCSRACTLRDRSAREEVNDERYE